MNPPSPDFQDLLTRFRALGGVAHNLRLGWGPRGRGLFAIDPREPIHLQVPAHLLLPTQQVVLGRDGQLGVAPHHRAQWAGPVGDFWDRYLRFISQDGEGLHALRRHQAALQALPPALKDTLGWLGGADEFKPSPSDSETLQKLLISRQIGLQGVSHLMPLADLLNHAPDGLPFRLKQGVQVHGRVADEVLACYHGHLDAFHFFFNYQLVTPSPVVLCCAVAVDLPGWGPLQVARLDHLSASPNAERRPLLRRLNRGHQLSFLELVRPMPSGSPQALMASVLSAQGLAPDAVEPLWHGLVAHHQQVLRSLLQQCQNHPGPLTAALETLARSQLALLPP